jgi:CIC family chloride channel protein
LQTISPKATLGELVEQIRTSKRNVFPVVNEKGEFVGMILLDAIRDVMFDGENYQTLLVEDLMTQPPALINLNETMYTVMQKFEQSEAWNLPVVDKKRYVGFVSKAQIFNKYRQLLVELSQD